MNQLKRINRRRIIPGYVLVGNITGIFKDHVATLRLKPTIGTVMLVVPPLVSAYYKDQYQITYTSPFPQRRPRMSICAGQDTLTISLY
jgi:hypothetical protein